MKLTLSVFIGLMFATIAPADDLTQLTTGVKTIHSGGAPGDIIAFGDKAFVVIADSSPARNPVVVAGRLEKGRVVALGHSSFLEPDSLKTGDSLAFVKNIIDWTSNGAKQPKIITLGFANTAKALKTVGFEASEGPMPKFEAGTILIASPGLIRDQKAVREFVEAGGGLIVGTPGWGWKQLNPGKSLAKDLPVSSILASAGLAFGEGFVERDKTSNSFLVGGNPESSHSGKAVDIVENWLTKGVAPQIQNAEAIRAAVNRLNGTVPDQYAKPLRERLAKSLTGAEGKMAIPTEKQPLGPKDPNSRLLLGITTQLMIDMPVESVKAHPAAAAFPGSVPKDALRVTSTVEINVDPTGFICNGVGVSSTSDIWHSTGLYAAPGEKITVTLPDEVVKLGYSVQIGCHTDRLWNLKSWQRAPQITRVEKVTSNTTLAANPFGGLVYILTPVKVKSGKVKVTIANAVAAPRYVFGQTTDPQWKEQRAHAGPWAELESDKIIIIVPSELARKVENPKEILEFWNKVQDCNADLTAVDRKRGRAERIVHDVQISAGYMHSGYPIMCPTSAAAAMLSIAGVQREGAWGYFHELGHNHQQREWTFEGTTEVTCNLYSLYVFSQLCPKAPLHDAIRPASIRKHAVKYKADGTDFAKWKNDPFTALIMFKQWEEAFGWASFQKLFAEYQKLPAKDKPKNDQDERDQLMVRMSKVVGKNLTKHFEYWGVPVTDAAKKSIADLPTWDFPDPTK